MHETMVLPAWRRAQAFATSVQATSLRLPYHASGHRINMQRAATSLVSMLGDSIAAQSPTQCARYLQLAVNLTGDLERHLDSVNQKRIVSSIMIAPLHVELTVMRRMLIAARRRVLATVAVT